MKKIITFTLIVCSLLTLILPVSASTYVRGYYRSNGTYVQPHYRSSANSSVYDNYSTKGNYNPYTGSQGYRTYPSYNYNYNSYSSGYNYTSYYNYGW